MHLLLNFTTKEKPNNPRNQPTYPSLLLGWFLLLVFFPFQKTFHRFQNDRAHWAPDTRGGQQREHGTEGSDLP